MPANLNPRPGGSGTGGGGRSPGCRRLVDEQSQRLADPVTVRKGRGCCRDSPTGRPGRGPAPTSEEQPMAIMQSRAEEG